MRTLGRRALHAFYISNRAAKDLTLKMVYKLSNLLSNLQRHKF